MKILLKGEFVFGIISILIVLILIVVSAVRYKQKGPQLSNRPVSSTIDPITILTPGEISKHTAATDCWIMVENKVYVVTDYLTRHPGGADKIIPYCGKKATQAFQTQGGKGTHSAEALRQLGMVYIGEVNGKVMRQPDKNTLKSLPIGGNENND